MGKFKAKLILNRSGIQAMKLDMVPPTTKKREDSEEEEEGGRQRMDWVGALLKDTKRLNFESRVRKVGRNSGMIILPGAWVGRRVKVNVELLD